MCGAVHNGSAMLPGRKSEKRCNSPTMSGLCRRVCRPQGARGLPQAVLDTWSGRVEVLHQETLQFHIFCSKCDSLPCSNTIGWSLHPCLHRST